MKKYLSLFFVLLFTGLIPLACVKCDSAQCGCGTGSKVNNYYVKNFETFKADGFGRILPDSNNFFNYNEVNIAIDVSEQKYALDRKLDFSFSNQAFACTPARPRSLNSISEIKITALNNLIYASSRDTIRSGESLNNRFGMKFSFVDKYSSIEEFVMRNYGFYNGETILFQLKSPPKNAVELKFRLEIVMSDSLELTYDNLILRVK